MKKLILITSLVASLVTAPALAKTEGNQIGISLVNSSVNHRYQQSGTTATNYKKFDDSAFGVGANYKYAFNFNRTFIAPGVFFDQVGTKAKDQDQDTISLNYRYGAKLDIGYDITDNFAAYVSGGYASVGYKVDWKSINQKKSDQEASAFYGIGVAYNVAKNLVTNLEYDVQTVTLKTPNIGGINEAKTNLGVLKLGVAYRF